MDENEPALFPEAEAGKVELFVFELNSVTFSVGVWQIQELIRKKTCPDVMSVPRSDPRVVGIFPIRDEIFSVIDLERCFPELFDKNNRKSDHEAYITCIFGKENVAFPVDTVLSVEMFDLKDVVPYSEVKMFDTNSIDAVVKYKNKMVNILDLEKVVDAVTKGEKV